MSVLVAGSLSSSTAIPQTQNTAPVLEFQCLYTSDIRRKQKRWQDGRLKFHTFNKRIMVYDDRSNFVADSHWREDHAFEEGEELEMDRCGILVQVCEFVGTREQDLTALLNRAVNDKRSVQVVGGNPAPLRPLQLDIRTQEVNLQRAEAGPVSTKRRKGNNFPSSSNGYAQSLTGATLSLSGAHSNAASAHYDPSLISSPNSLVKNNYKSHNDGRVVAPNMTKAKANGQTKRVLKGLSKVRLDSSYSEKITGAVLVLASRAPTGYRLPPVPGTAEEATPPLNRTDLASITSEDDEFIDIDVYDTKGSSLEMTMDSLSELIGPGKTEQAKLLPNFLTKEPQSADNQSERPSNPLRIRTRPKKKLLSTATLSSRPSPLTMTCVGSELSGVTTADISYKLDPFAVTVQKVIQVTEAGPSLNPESCLSHPITVGIDHHSIDKMLARKDSEDTRMAKTQHENMQARTQNKYPVQSAIEIEEVTRIEGQERVLSSHIPYLQPERDHEDSERKRLSMVSFGNTDIEVKRGRTSNSRPPRSSPRSMQPSDGTVTLVTEDIEAIRPAYQSRGLAATRDTILFKSPANLNRSQSQSTTKIRKDSKQGDNNKNGASKVVINIESAVSVSKVRLAHTVAVANNDQGPWTREAFDLFGWRPDAGTVGDGLKAG